MSRAKYKIPKCLHSGGHRTPTLERWDGGATRENVKILKQDVIRILKDIDLYKARGPDEIAPYVLKECTETPDKRLKSSESYWKRHHSRGSGKEQTLYLFLRNYRPVPLTTAVCKILEKITRRQIDEDLERRYCLTKDGTGSGGRGHV